MAAAQIEGAAMSSPLLAHAAHRRRLEGAHAVHAAAGLHS
eukprot:COSAG01_NODE_4956_length_4590_cov_7.535070_1_plen_39_part_10